jgi:pimeloyl-ACP methyl ester carboxylesterase
MAESPAVTRVEHGRISLALHRLRDGADGARSLLLLHGLGERSPRALPPVYTAWPGAVFALDFTGHGESTVPQGGGYTPEVLMGDADAALGVLGRATIVGRGLGAYIALLLAGGRPNEVRGAILLDGPGLGGGGPAPGSPAVIYIDPAADAPPDQYALAELTRDPRPPDYASAFARLAIQSSGLAEPISVAAVGRPPWLEAVVDEPGVRVSRLPDALAAYAAVE